LGDKTKRQGKRCDLQKEGGPNHNVAAGGGLRKDPLGRTKVIRVGGIDKNEVMELCQACYQRARSDKVQRQGLRCDLQQTEEPDHNVASGGLKMDPLRRTKVIRVDGIDKNEVMKLCHACYQKARSDKAKQQGKHRDLQQKERHSHHTIKRELFAGDRECLVVSSSRRVRKTDDFLPILQDPQDPHRSLLLEIEGPIEGIQCANWGSLGNLNKKHKKQVTKQVKEWLVLNEYKREQYGQRLQKMLEIAYPIDEGPDRGRSIFARRDIAKYTVVCPYAGVLHSDVEGLQRAMRKNGSQHVLSYLFSTRSDTRVVDASETGNMASLVNTSQLGDTPPFKENNVAPVLFGKNLIFYIALWKIKAGEELFIDYGPNYNPQQRILDIKQETSVSC
jgi:hypothetical protein